MIELNPSDYAGELPRFLLSRGTAVPPLRWTRTGDPLIKDVLDQIEDDKLLGVEEFTNWSLATVVRSLLYLWLGCPDECSRHGQAAPAREAAYLAAMCHRQGGRFDDAKTALSTVGEHDIHPQLARYVMTSITPSRDRALQRFVDTVKLERQWEPHAFVDLYARALAGSMTEEAEKVVACLQCREFEMLLDWAYVSAGGRKNVQSKPDSQQADEARRRRRKRREEAESLHHRRQQAAVERKKVLQPASPTQKIDAASSVGVRCPKCQKLAVVPESARGKTVTCDACGTAFRIPDKSAA